VLSLEADGDRLFLETGDARVAALAKRLWPEAPPGDSRPHRYGVFVRVVEGGRGEIPREPLAWTVTEDRLRLDAPGLTLEALPREGAARGSVSSSLLDAAPDLFVRTLLESPVTAMKMVSRQLLHAGALAGPKGVVVIRGGPGAGKSTLVGAGWKAGLGVLGDESLLVRRDDPDRLEATLRDLTLTEDAARLLGLEGRTLPTVSGGEAKRRVPLLDGAAPEDRVGRRVATLLLGPRAPGPARLVPLSGEAFVAAFSAGGIPQEARYGGTPEATARAWAGRATFRLDGAVDLEGALRLVTTLTN
jgi:hypothetical protein